MINETAVTAQGIGALKQMKFLANLNVAACKSIDDTAVSALKDLKNLKELTVRGTAITGEGVIALEKALPQCKVISK